MASMTKMLPAVVLLVAALCFHKTLFAQRVPGAAPSAAAFQLSLTPDTVEDSVTQNVTLQCRQNKFISSKVAMISNIQIMKRQDGDMWATFAEIREGEPNVRTNQNVLASGNVDNNTFLQIIWPTATNETFGQYRCDVVGFDSSFSNAEETSSILTIVKHNITAREVLDLLLKEQFYGRQELARQKQEQENRFSAIIISLNESHRLIENLAEQLNRMIQTQNNLQNETETALQNLEDSVGKSFVPVIRDIDTIFSDLKRVANISHTSTTVTTVKTTTIPPTLSAVRIAECRNKTLENDVERDSWPEGTFGLLMPNSGCPNNNQCIEWETSFYKFDTEMDNNHNEVSNNSHLATPITEAGSKNKTYMYQRFCVVTKDYPNPPWPNGTYCINRGIEPCPTGFDEGWIHFHEENKDHKSNIVGGAPLYRYYVANIFYCCRADGPQDTPIVLPTSKPFYLYRYHNTCQEVEGMTVTEEYILVDTENDVNRDNADKTHYHPDATLNDVNITLCYYQTEHSDL